MQMSRVASKQLMAAVAAGLFAAAVLVIAYRSGDPRESSPLAAARTATNIDQADGGSLDTASPPLPDALPPEVDLHALERLCPDLWGDAGERCLEVLEARFGGEELTVSIAGPTELFGELAAVRARR